MAPITTTLAWSSTSRAVKEGSCLDGRVPPPCASIALVPRNWPTVAEAPSAAAVMLLPPLMVGDYRCDVGGLQLVAERHDVGVGDLKVA